jgi:AraC-like DNA-binding protein
MLDPLAQQVPAAYVRDILEVSAQCGVTADALLAGLSITADALAVPATRIPIPLCAEIVARAERLTRHPALAIQVGMQMRLSTHGFLGFAAMTSSTVREALDLAVRFAGTRTTALGLTLAVEGATASLAIQERAPLGTLREFALISVMVGLWRIGEALTGRVVDGVAHCDFTPAGPTAGILLATGRMRFGQPTNRMVFDATLLDRPLVTADPLAAQLARGECERELATVAEAGLLGQVRAAITTGGDGVPSLAEVARELHLSTRTLKRKLADHGTTFTAILEDVRRQRALMLLGDRALSIGEVAARLGYSELPNFSRAFRKWTGMTPAAYRARHADER